jgi:cyclopropane-fatty-acyl-phospholipid synthase
MRLLTHLLRGFIKTGTLELIDAHGSRHLFGTAPGPAVVARIHDSALHIRLALNPELAAAEAYMDGTLTFEGGSTAHDLLLLFSVNRDALGAIASQKLLRRAWRALRRRPQANTAARATDNARSHYDVPVDVYRLFLDAGLNYSCGFFHDPETDTLEQAQEAKLARATAKLGLRPGMRVAEIGSGWGSFAVHIAKSTGARVTAINVSPEQLAVSRMLAEREGVTDLVEFLELDYRALEGRFDRVVSVGMMEHVGIGHFDAYPAKIRSAVGGGEDPRINGAGLWYSAPFCGDDAAVLAAVQHASRRLRRCPAGMLDRHCARRAEGTQVGTTGWPS